MPPYLTSFNDKSMIPTPKIMQDETFGPVMPVMEYRTGDEAVRLANDTYFGLSAAVIAGTVEEAREEI